MPRHKQNKTWAKCSQSKGLFCAAQRSPKGRAYLVENFLSFAKLLAMGCNTNFGGYGNSTAHFTPNEESYAQQGLE